MLTLDFVIIGAQKSGTTLLVDLLLRSPRVAVPRSEVRYFRDPFFPEHERPDEFFGPGDQAKLKGIKHPSYLGQPEVPARIKDHSPDAKLIAILRDPVERALASYVHYLRFGQIPCIHPDLGIPIAFGSPDASPKYRDIVEFGDYARYLSLFLEHFPREQLLVLELEEFVRSPAAVNSLFEFLSLPAPPGLWPLHRVNEGIYDWGECQRLHHESTKRFVYDEAANIIGDREGLRPAAGPFDPQPLQLSSQARSLLASHYRSQRESLRALGLLDPHAWSRG